MAVTLPPELAQKQANLEAPNNQLGQQDPAKQVAKDRKQPGKKKGPARKLYPNMASNEADTGED